MAKYFNLDGYTGICVTESDNSVIEITGCNIEDAELILALSAIRASTCSTLIIRNNKLTNVGAIALARTLNASIYIKEVHIGTHNILSDGIAEFHKMPYISLKKITLAGDVIVERT